MGVVYVVVVIRSTILKVQQAADLRLQAMLALSGERCHRCGGEFEAWHGRLDPVRDLIDYVPGAQSYVKYEIHLTCLPCRVPTTFWVWTDGKLMNRDREHGLP
jgi:hypothetical protein